MNKTGIKRMNRNFNIIIEKDNGMYVSFCPELDIASQGNSIEDSRQNLKEAIELFFEIASDTEILRRTSKAESYISQLEVEIG